MPTMATLLSAMRMILDQSFYSSLRALDSCRVILSSGCTLLRSLLVSVLSPTADFGVDIGNHLCYIFSFRGVFRDHHKTGAPSWKQSLHLCEVGAGHVYDPFFLCVVIVPVPTVTYNVVVTNMVVFIVCVAVLCVDIVPDVQADIFVMVHVYEWTPPLYLCCDLSNLLNCQVRVLKFLACLILALN